MNRKHRRGLCAVLATTAGIAAAAGPGTAMAAFPGENGAIAYTHSHFDDGNLFSPPNAQIRTLQPGGARTLTAPNGFATEPAFSPNGRLIAYTARRGSGATNIHRMRADGRGKRAVTRSRQDDSQPAWAPNGRWIVFVKSTPRGRELFLIRRDGRKQRRLTRNGRHEDAPAWSPNGRWIAFMRATRRGSPQVLKMRPNGRRVQRVAAGGEFPSWSPNSRRIAFDRSSPTSGDREIFTVKHNGRGLRQLTQDPITAFLDDIRPEWSPDGRWIVFTRDASELWLVQSNGGEPRELLSAPEPEGDSYELLGFPTWQPR